VDVPLAVRGPAQIDHIYDGSNCTGRSVYVASTLIVKLWTLSPTFDNKASSIKVVYF
jgi:hypothetical protein